MESEAKFKVGDHVLYRTSADHPWSGGLVRRILYTGQKAPFNWEWTYYKGLPFVYYVVNEQDPQRFGYLRERDLTSASAPRFKVGDMVQFDVRRGRLCGVVEKVLPRPDNPTGRWLTPYFDGCDYAYRLAFDVGGSWQPERVLTLVKGYDSPTGMDAAPTRYTQQGRETIDRMRDKAYAEARAFLRWGAQQDAVEKLADAMFQYHCEATALKYEDRKGAKGDPEKDAEKALFYRTMSRHVNGECPDPRCNRADFKPYERQEWADAEE